MPDDDLGRDLTVADSQGGRHVSVAGNTYTILLDSAQTNGAYCLIDMHVPPGGGPPPHRHDFEESFVVLEGEILATFRGEESTVRAGQTINIPANAPHQFKNVSDAPARLLCTCTPAGQEQFFLEVGVPVNSRTAPPPELSEEQREEITRKSQALTAKYRTEMIS